jgi:signal transduction histidine kinase
MNHSPTGHDPEPGSEGRSHNIREVGHDLRNCMYTVRTGIQLLKKLGLEQDKYGEIMTIMERDLEKATVLVNELIEMARKN